MDNFEQLKQDVYEDRLKLNALIGQVGQLSSTPSTGGMIGFQPVPLAPQIPAANQLRNGDLSHSTNTYNEPTPAAPGSDSLFECAWFYSNDEPVAGQQLSLANALTTSVNQTLKSSGHSTYNVNYSDWDNTKGTGRFQGTTSVDAPFPNNTATPGKIEALGVILARRNATIRIPDPCQFCVGVWDNTTGELDWLTGTPFSLTAEVQGSPATTTERRYVVFALTDRGYTFLSQEVTVAAAPSDAAYLAGATVRLSWEYLAGIIQYQIYRHDITAGEFHLLESPTSGVNSYIDNGTITDVTVTGYPSATDSAPKAFVATQPGALEDLAIDGVSASWSSFYMNVQIPATYDQGNTTANQIFRMFLSTALDREMEDAVVSNGDPTVTSVSADFTALDVGRSVVLTSADEQNSLTTTIASLTSESEIELTDAPTWSDSASTLYITGGGDHGLLFDLVHLSYHTQAVYAPFPDDLNRTLQPTASPNGSSQGTIGGGGVPTGGEGGPTCIALDCPVNVMRGDKLSSIPYHSIIAGHSLYSGSMHANSVRRLRPGITDNLIILRTSNWIELPCSPSHQVRVNRLGLKRRVDMMRVGDQVVTSINGRVEMAKVAEIIHTGQRVQVGTFELEPSHTYSAGYRYYKNSLHRFSMWVLESVRGPDVVGVLSSNAKPIENQV